jgi:hypothetical protein
MTVLVVVLLIFAAALIGYLLRQASEQPPALPPDPEAVQKAALELHRIRTRFDVAWTKTEQRSDSARLRREIAEAMKDGDGR